jgi:hypothetical protein
MPTKGRRLGGSPAHQRHMLANLAAALFEHCKITTTEARARRLRPVADRLITLAKRGRPARPAPGSDHGHRQEWRAHAIRRDRAELRSPRGRLHPDHQGELMVLVMGTGTRQAGCGALPRRTLTAETASCYPTGG